MKNMKLKTTAIITAVLLISTFTTASTIGTYTSEESKDIEDLDATFEIKAMNLGDQTAKISLETTEPEYTNIYYFQGDSEVNEYQLEPSTVTENPENYELEENQEWFLMDGEYVETTKIPITITIDQERTVDNFEFTTELNAQESLDLEPENEEDEDVAPQQEIIQTRTFDFRVSTNADRESPTQETTTGETDGTTDGDDSGETDTSGSLSIPTPGSSGFIEESADEYELTIEESGNEDTELEESENTDTTHEEGTTESQDSETEENTSVTGDFMAAASANFSTILLFLTSILSIFYLVRVM